jgi:hypothetical protein
MLFAALAFALAFGPRRIMLLALAAAPIPTIVVASLALPKAWTGAIFIVCWLSVIVTAAFVHVRRPLGLNAAMPLAINAAIWGGATIASAGTASAVIKALPVLLLAFPAKWLVNQQAGLSIKVVASWLVAIAILAIGLTAVPTPGYIADHME